jgi:predicted O-methyltransferase YrrM
MLPNNFQGQTYRLSDNWEWHMHVEDYSLRPINYLEIGAYYGANLLSVANYYGKHPDSKLYAIDPWSDYDEYPEYKGRQSSIYNTFLRNICESGHADRIIIKRGYSNDEIPKLPDDFFDIIYIDGNHQPEFVLEDAVLSFRKLKQGGVMIFDDYGWGGPDLTQRGVDAFLSGYRDKITRIRDPRNTQLFIKKN